MTERGPIQLEWTRISQIGMRTSNQDALGEAQHGNVACFVVADGAGGHLGGEVASKTVVEAVLGKFADTPAVSAQTLLVCAEHAAQQVATRQLEEPGLRDMSTTVAALLLDCSNGKALWAHLGDTRIYLFRAGALVSVSKDHSLTQQLIDAGYAKAEQLRQHPQRNILFAAIGADGDTPVTLCDEQNWLKPGDALLICTDGLWEWVQETEMQEALAGASCSADWMSRLCQIADGHALASGKERDNYSAYAILVQEVRP